MTRRDKRIDGPIGDVYAVYDGDPRVGGPDDFSAFADAVQPMVDAERRLARAILTGSDLSLADADYEQADPRHIAAVQAHDETCAAITDADLARAAAPGPADTTDDGGDR